MMLRRHELLSVCVCVWWGSAYSKMAATLNAIRLQTACSSQWDKNINASRTQQWKVFCTVVEMTSTFLERGKRESQCPLQNNLPCQSAALGSPQNCGNEEMELPLLNWQPSQERSHMGFTWSVWKISPTMKWNWKNRKEGVWVRPADGLQWMLQANVPLGWPVSLVELSNCWNCCW